MYSLAILKHPLVIYQQLIVKISIYLSWWVAGGFTLIVMKISVKVGLKLANWNWASEHGKNVFCGKQHLTHQFLSNVKHCRRWRTFLQYFIYTKIKLKYFEILCRQKNADIQWRYLWNWRETKFILMLWC